MANFWQTLPKPFWCLAPMEDVTDTVFRQIVASVGRPHVFFTEFVNVEGIVYGAQPVLQRLAFSEIERPIVAQIWGSQPETFLAAAKKVAQMGFDGIDINMGCPVRNITKQGGCSALIGHSAQVAEIIAATKEGAGGLPVSVKTRIGQKKIITEDWIGFLLTQKLDALTIHGRTAAEKSLVAAHWDEIAKATKLPNPFGTRLIGNGDVKSLTEARSRVEETGVDGIMIGRGIFDNVALFSEIDINFGQKMTIFKRHAHLYEHTWGKTKNFQVLKKVR